MITSNYSISVNLYWRKTYIFVIKIKTLSYNCLCKATFCACSIFLTTLFMG
ncbi:hypothetical protein [Arsenophonus endosymbiont of Bemisia tabaci]|uniref:hypothetical protein n=1 Tax=Arsenophonus endosymbiont of Bemisia tabaci TaxID=536059 RepID=UPI0015F50B87|nr:hypothetical protein [Arsenophonus endosymbiont of Bemisia tabaci]